MHSGDDEKGPFTCPMRSKDRFPHAFPERAKEGERAKQFGQMPKCIVGRDLPNPLRCSGLLFEPPRVSCFTT